MVNLVGMKSAVLKFFALLTFGLCMLNLKSQAPQIGAFYFDGWTQVQWDNYTKLDYQGGPYSDKLIHEYSDREPAYGWVTSTEEGVQLQIDDALEAGLDFFIFDWYYCKGKGYDDCFLNNALRLFMENKQSALKFTSMITNDAYDIGPDEWEETKTKLKEQFQHPAYYKVKDRPVVYIYLGAKMINAFGGMKNFNKALKEFKKECKALGLGEPLIGVANIVEDYSIRKLRFSDFLFTYNQPVLVYNYKIEPLVDNQYDINVMIESEEKYWPYLFDKAENKSFVPTLTVGWDARPWNEATRVIYTKPTREYVQKAVNTAIKFNEHYSDKPLENMVLIYSWNEYGEGGYISRMKNGEFIGMGIRDAKNEYEEKQ